MNNYLHQFTIQITTVDMQIPKSLLEKIMQSPVHEWLDLIIEETQRVLDEPPLPREHPDAAKQLQAKVEAEAALDWLRKAIKPLEKVCHQELLKLIDAPLRQLSKSTRLELKQSARIALLLHDAHYGPGGPYEGLQDEDEE